MKIKVLESALAHIGHRLYSLERKAQDLKSLLKTPISLQPLVGSANRSQQEVVDALDQIQKDLVVTAQPLLDDWLMALGAVRGEQVTFSIKGRQCYVSKMPGGHYYHSAIAIDEAIVTGTISEMKLIYCGKKVCIVLDQAQVAHHDGTRTSIQTFPEGHRVRYGNEYQRRTEIELITGASVVEIGIPLQAKYRENLTLTKA